MMWTKAEAGQIAPMTPKPPEPLSPKAPMPLFSEAGIVSMIEAFLYSFETVFSSATHHRKLNVAGATFEVASYDLGYIDQAARALSTREGASTTSCRIAVINANDNACAAPVWPFETFHEREVEAALAKTQYRLHYFSDLNFWQVFDTQRKIGIQWMTAADGSPLWDSGSPLRNFVQWRLGGKTASLLHGGTLALAECGVLLAGAGGAGKSSTVLAGIFGGLQSVGDDYVLVDSETLTARAIFDTLKQDEAGLRRIGQWDHAAIPKEANWQNKYQFYLPDVGAGALPASIALRAILLPKLTHGPTTTITPISAKEAFLALAPSGVTQIHCDRARLFSVAGQVSRKLPAYQLQLGTQPDEIVGVLRQFLEETCRSSL